MSTVKLTGLPLGQQTYFNQSREYLNSLEESDKNRDIIESYTYGTPLIGTYLETYNNMVDLYNAQIQALFPVTGNYNMAMQKIDKDYLFKTTVRMIGEEMHFTDMQMQKSINILTTVFSGVRSNTYSNIK